MTQRFDTVIACVDTLEVGQLCWIDQRLAEDNVTIFMEEKRSTPDNINFRITPHDFFIILGGVEDYAVRIYSARRGMGFVSMMMKVRTLKTAPLDGPKNTSGCQAVDSLRQKQCL